MGGSVDLCDVPAAHAELASHAQKAIGAQIIGFDMILHQGVPIVVDENTFPGFYPERNSSPMARTTAAPRSASSSGPTSRTRMQR
ncbi:hypothetical protein [Streptomyces natalensis]|uniref:hypothetical protein n=1 Tax=Streptomyces natalensis TaxID=68242 RepID=UPI000A571DAB|nr:hypothetical protein [Streptomyces natalensis]